MHATRAGMLGGGAPGAAREVMLVLELISCVLCFAAAGPMPPPPPPRVPPLQPQLPPLQPRWRNWSLPTPERVASLVGLLTRREKVAQLSGLDTPAVPRVGLPAYNYYGGDQLRAILSTGHEHHSTGHLMDTPGRGHDSLHF